MHPSLIPLLVCEAGSVIQTQMRALRDGDTCKLTVCERALGSTRDRLLPQPNRSEPHIPPAPPGMMLELTHFATF